ncbi:hypothetical protein JTE90_022707 [Oedothorax gibbosus]|uniref:Cuticle protein n=1 Tax=Oedothorax gibbosus TaxID=931172 RepID=A0AAV6UR85_9ARAC|nr:hypothetical protein JTE90_022707 [Oedothorax gibbosus]
MFPLFSNVNSFREDPNSFNSKARKIETYSSRYDNPTNDPTLIAKTPFAFGYRFTDDYGTMQTREEKTDPNGSKTGSYSFIDATGTYRQVDYIADSHGFRATVKTNEPGTLPAEPADVSIQVENDRSSQRNARHLPPQLEFSNHVFSRYKNYSSDNYGQRTEYPSNPLQGHADPSFFKDPLFGINPPSRQQYVPPQKDHSYTDNLNQYNSPQYPPRQPLRKFSSSNWNLNNPIDYPNLPDSNPNSPVDFPKLPRVNLNNPVDYPKLPDLNINNPVDYPKLPRVNLNNPIDYPKLADVNFNDPLNYPKLPGVNLNNPLDYPKVPSFDVDEFFQDPNLNPSYAFGDKIADFGNNNKREYSLLPPSPSSSYPSRQSSYRSRPKHSRQQYKIHTPKGYENNPNLPIYKDK